MSQSAPPPPNLPGAPEEPEDRREDYGSYEHENIREYGYQNGPYPEQEYKHLHEHEEKNHQEELYSFEREQTPPKYTPVSEDTPREKNPPEQKEIKPEPPKDRTVENGSRDLKILIGIFVFVIFLYLISLLFGGGGNSNENSSQTATNAKIAATTTAVIPGVAGTSTPLASHTALPPQSSSQGFFSFLGLGNQNQIPLSTQTTSFYHGWVSITADTATDIYPGREYITLKITKDNLSYLDMTNWSVENSAGQRFSLGKASYLPLEGKTNTPQALVVNAGDTIIVSSGQSPLGVSFRQNACSGYLEQYRDFFPEIPQQCPAPPRNSLLDNACQNYINQIPRCQQATAPMPNDISPSCQNFISTEINYNACVANSQDDPRFYSSIWRVYLNQNTEIWKEPHDSITLLDNDGKIVAITSY